MPWASYAMEICNKSSCMHECCDHGSESLWKFWPKVFWKMFPKSAELFSSSRLVVSLRVQVNFHILFSALHKIPDILQNPLWVKANLLLIASLRKIICNSICVITNTIVSFLCLKTFSHTKDGLVPVSGRLMWLANDSLQGSGNATLLMPVQGGWSPTEQCSALSHCSVGNSTATPFSCTGSAVQAMSRILFLSTISIAASVRPFQIQQKQQLAFAHGVEAWKCKFCFPIGNPLAQGRAAWHAILTASTPAPGQVSHVSVKKITAVKWRKANHLVCLYFWEVAL